MSILTIDHDTVVYWDCEVDCWKWAVSITHWDEGCRQDPLHFTGVAESELGALEAAHKQAMKVAEETSA